MVYFAVKYIYISTPHVYIANSSSDDNHSTASYSAILFSQETQNIKLSRANANAITINVTERNHHVHK